jgi:hypothetical protein
MLNEGVIYSLPSNLAAMMNMVAYRNVSKLYGQGYQIGMKKMKLISGYRGGCNLVIGTGSISTNKFRKQTLHNHLARRTQIYRLLLQFLYLGYTQRQSIQVAFHILGSIGRNKSVEKLSWSHAFS